jgi:hypothetical protein
MFSRVLIIALSSLAIYFSSLSPSQLSYDTIGYVASAYTYDGFKGAELQNKTVQDIKDSVSEKKFKTYCEGSEFWTTVLTDPKSLQQIVPLYAMRIVYIDLMRFVHSFGATYTMASIQVSAFFGALSVIVLALIIVKINLSIAMLPLVILATNLLGVAQLPSPDTLACFFALLSIYLLMIESRMIFLISVFMPLARTDLIVLSGLLMLYLFFNSPYKNKPKLTVIISMTLSIVAFVLANKLHGNYGLLNLFNNHHIHPSPYPADITISSSLKDYILPYIRLIRDTLASWHTVIYLISTTILLYSKRNGYDIKYLYPLFLIPFSYVLLHIMLFPTYYERYFIFSILLMLLGIIHFLKYQLLLPKEKIHINNIQAS